jgi:hypothetical protein
MRLSCQKAFVLVVASTIGCHETTAPPVAGSYVLESINGQPIPANIQAEGGDTITVIYSSLTLDAAGKAQLSEHIRYVHPNSPPGEVTYTTGYSYRLVSNVIEGKNIVFDFSPPCPPNALCPVPPTGTFVGSKLVLSWGPTPQSRPPSVYRPVDPTLTPY